ncbi:hypothetical protein [Actinosynnema sp. NPDC023587]|uniref:hypothetical protein n=1 Tax=Actinosynnema sp. NPDC023587 TaxID=3154695 RepID=UPI0034088AFC
MRVVDLGELVTAANRSRRNRVPTITPTRAVIAIGVAGAVITAASAEGVGTGGRSPFFHAAPTGFGSHSITRVAVIAVYPDTPPM